MLYASDASPQPILNVTPFTNFIGPSFMNEKSPKGYSSQAKGGFFQTVTGAQTPNNGHNTNTSMGRGSQNNSHSHHYHGHNNNPNGSHHYHNNSSAQASATSSGMGTKDSGYHHGNHASSNGMRKNFSSPPYKSNGHTNNNSQNANNFVPYHNAERVKMKLFSGSNNTSNPPTESTTSTHKSGSQLPILNLATSSLKTQPQSIPSSHKTHKYVRQNLHHSEPDVSSLEDLTKESPRFSYDSADFISEKDSSESGSTSSSVSSSLSFSPTMKSLANFSLPKVIIYPKNNAEIQKINMTTPSESSGLPQPMKDMGTKKRSLAMYCGKTFSIMYPTSWSQEKVPTNFAQEEGVLFLGEKADPLDPTEFRENFSVLVEDLSKCNSGLTTLDEYSHSVFQWFSSSPDYFILGITQTLFSGLPAYSITVQCENLTHVQTWLVKDKKATIATYTCESSTFLSRWAEIVPFVKSLRIFPSNTD